MRNGEDITEEIKELVAKKAKAERFISNNFGEAVAYLNAARVTLENTPRPWQNDCIYDSIVAISEIIKVLSSE